MQKKLFIGAIAVLMSGCTSTISPAPQAFDNNGKKIIVGYEEPSKVWECGYKGQSKFNANSKYILSLISSGPSFSNATQMGTDDFAKKAPKFSANYVYRTMYTQSGFFFYITSDEDTGKYYTCKNLPQNLVKK
jgi:hypothetical protein